MRGKQIWLAAAGASLLLVGCERERGTGGAGTEGSGAQRERAAEPQDSQAQPPPTATPGEEQSVTASVIEVGPDRVVIATPDQGQVALKIDDSTQVTGAGAGTGGAGDQGQQGAQGQQPQRGQQGAAQLKKGDQVRATYGTPSGGAEPTAIMIEVVPGP